MSDTVWHIVLVVALLLATYSLSVLLGFSPMAGKTGPEAYVTPTERPRRALLVAGSALAGLAAVASAFSWSEWPAGLLLGVAAVELGPFAFGQVRRLASRVFKRLPGDKN